MLNLGLSQQEYVLKQPQHLSQVSFRYRLLAGLLLLVPFLLFCIALLLALASEYPATKIVSEVAIVLTVLIFLRGVLSLSQVVHSAIKTRRSVLSRLANKFTMARSPKVPPVSILFCPKETQQNCEETLRSLLALDYPEYELIVVNDGSVPTEKLLVEFGLEPVNKVFKRSLMTGSIHDIYASKKYPKLLVVSKPRSNLADSLNVGINLARSPLICFFEDECVLTRDGLSLLAKPFIEYPNLTVISAATAEMSLAEDAELFDAVKIASRKRLFHSSSFLRALLCIASGLRNSVSIFRKADLIRVGGFQEAVMGEAVSLLLRSGLAEEHRVSHVADVLCWKLSSARPEVELGQWQASAVLMAATGLAAARDIRLLPGYLLLLVECYAPILELLGLVLVLGGFLTGLIGSELVLLFFMTLISMALLESVSGIVADEFSLRHQHTVSETLLLVFASIIEAVLYRQVANYYRVKGILEALLKA
ncbi:MAG: glycosyltransferase family 2 protein [Acidobacteriota bacterium]|nr:glycosyltransferase family 2 protein [Blastocatellia bacterium]MDW8412172.1 glycosyltransferase family 2 protein [Acidobacteriota bacterium]